MFLHCTEHDIPTPSSESRHALNNDPTGSDVSDDSHELPEQAGCFRWRFFRTDAFASTNIGDAGTGKSTGDEIDLSASSPNVVSFNILHIPPSWQARPVLLKDEVAVRVNLTLADDLESGPRET